MIKHKVVIILLLAIMVAALTSQTNAEPRRKKHARKHRQYDTTAVAANVTDTPIAAETQHYSRKEQRRMERQERKRKRHERRHNRHAVTTVDKERKTAIVVTKRPEIEYPLTTLRSRYRIDVLMPMYLDELVKGGAVKSKIPEKALSGIAFYQGVTIASDSLRKAGFDMDIYIHDIGSAAESVNELVGKDKMDSTDLIIGAIPSKDIPALADYAKRKQVNFISALSPADGGVTNNLYFTLIQPSLRTHCEWITGEVAKKFPGQRVTLLYRTSTEADANAYKYLTNGAGDNNNLWQLLCDKVPAKEALAPLFDTTKPNVVIISVLDNVYADSLLKALSVDFPGTAFDVYGMPTWNDIPGLHKANAYPNLTVYVTDPFNYDVNSATGRYVARTYKQDYGTKAPELVYRGYETMFWYANLLKQYGTIFNEKYSDNSFAPFTKFEIKQQWDKDGNILYNENTHIFLSTYQGGSFKTE